MAEQQQSHGQLALELDCAEYDVKDVSFSPGPADEAGLFSCSITPIADETLAALERAVNTQTPISLRFSDCPVLLDLVTLERKAPRSVRIVGHVVRPGEKAKVR